jgi:hypothetical protein
MPRSDSDDDTEIVVDPERIEDFLLDCDTYFDSAKPGRYDDRSRITYALKVSKCDRGLSDTLRDWKRHGVSLEGGDHREPWNTVSWRALCEALRGVYPTEPEADDAADELAALVQNGRVPVHNAAFMRLSEAAGEKVDMESTSRLAIKRYIMTLNSGLHPDMVEEEDSVAKVVGDAFDKGNIKKMKHAMNTAAVQDKLLFRVAGRKAIRGGAYWKGKKTGIGKGLKKKINAMEAEINFVSEGSPTMKMSEEMAELKMEQTQIRADMKSELDKSRTDNEKRFQVVESKVDSTHELCTKIMGGIQQLQSGNTTAGAPAISYPPASSPDQGTTQGWQQVGNRWQGGKG